MRRNCVVRRFACLALVPFALSAFAAGHDGAVQSSPDVSRWRGFNLLGMFRWTDSTKAQDREDMRSPGRYSEEQFKWIAEWGFNFVRLPMDYRNFLVSTNDWTTFKEASFRKVDEAVGFGRKYGVHVQLCLHRAPGFTCLGWDPEPTHLATDAESQRLFFALWREFARRYRGCPNREVSFNPLNEPGRKAFTEAQFNQVFGDCVKAIHAADPDRFVMLDGMATASTPALAFKDVPLTGQAFRGYVPHAITHYGTFYVAQPPREPDWPIDPKLLTEAGENYRWLFRSPEEACDAYKPLQDAGYPVMIGEFGCHSAIRHETCLKWMEHCLKLWQKRNLGWALWNLDGDFGILDSGRKDVAYEKFRGHLLDRKMLDLLQKYAAPPVGKTDVARAVEWRDPAIADDAAEVRRFKEWTERRLTEMTDLVHGLVVKRIPSCDLATRVAALAEQAGAAKTLTDYRALDAAYRPVRADYEVARRMLELYSEARAMQRTGGGAAFISAWKDAASAMRDGKWADAAAQVKVLEARRCGDWNELLADKTKWRTGLDHYSTGRFGWFWGSGGGLADCATWGDVLGVRGFVTGKGVSPAFSFRPSSAKTSRRTCTNVTWTCAEVETPLKNGGRWRAYDSSIAPGRRWWTDEAGVEFGWLRPVEHSPRQILGVFGGEPKVYRRGEEVPWPQLSENWLLLVENDGAAEFPVVITLTRRPDSVLWRDTSIRISRSGGIGAMSAGLLRGIAPLRPIADVRPLFDEARRLALRLNAYPMKCREDFRFVGDEVEIRNVFTFLSEPNDWGTPAAELAVVPPLAVFAAEEAGYPFRPQNAVCRTGRVNYHGYEAVSDSKEFAYRLPLVDMDNVRHLGATDAPRDIIEKLNLSRTYWHLQTHCGPNAWKAGPERNLGVASGPYLTWCAMDEANREFFAHDGIGGLEALVASTRRFARLEKGSNPGHVHLARCEPHTAASYLAYGWKKTTAGREHIGDVANFRGIGMGPLFDYFDCTGNWAPAREFREEIRRRFDALPVRADWSVMGLDCMEDGASHQIDMGPDAWLGVLAWNRFARVFGDRRDRELSAYMAAKEAIPLVTQFFRRRHAMEYYNTWNWERQIPECGWGNLGGVMGCEWRKNAHISFNQMGGVAPGDEEFRLYDRYCPNAMGAYLQRIHRHYPEWNRFLKPSGNRNNFNMQGQVIQLLAWQGDSREHLYDCVRNAYAVGMPCEPWQYAGFTSIGTLHGAAMTAIAAENPLYVAWHYPAALGEGVYDPSTKTSRVTFTAQSDFSAEFGFGQGSDVERGLQVRVNGRDVKPTRRGNRLVVRCEPKDGRAVVEVATPNWKPRVRRTFVPQEVKEPSNELIAYAQAEAKAGEEARKGLFEPVGTLESVLLRGMPLPSGVKPGRTVVRGVAFEIGPEAVPDGTQVKIGRRCRAVYLLYHHGNDLYAVRRETPYDRSIMRGADTSQLQREMVEFVTAADKLVAVTVEAE